ncbi:MAG: hypothetical protein ACREUQ_06315, partial [Burkholderiales bacterium]
MSKLLTLACIIALLALGSGAARAQQGAADPDDISDVLERSKARGKLVVCADPYDFPYSSQGSMPPGFDVEIMRELAKRGGMQLEMYWADTGTRGGTSRAFRNSIMKGRCDVFTGISDSGDDDMLMG